MSTAITEARQEEILAKLADLTDAEVRWLADDGMRVELRARSNQRRQRGYAAERAVWQLVDRLLPADARRGLELGKASALVNATDNGYQGVLLITPKNSASTQASGFIRRAHERMTGAPLPANTKVELLNLSSYPAIRVAVRLTEQEVMNG